MTGNVNLSGYGTIGVHTRNEGAVNVTGSGHVVFKSGKNQIGYYVFGAGSHLNNSSVASEAVSTENSTLYRIDNGANFSGSNASTINVSGVNASAFQITGKDSSFDSGSLTINIDGSEASGVRVEGGATGHITADAVFNLSGTNASAGIVDGKFYSITGLATGATGKSVLTSAAKLSTGNTATEAHGYIIRNGGQLNHTGSIDSCR